MLKESVKRGITFLADYKGADLKNSFIDKTIRPDYIKINKAELLQTFSENNLSVEEIIKKITKQYNNTLIITDGDGPILISCKGDLSQIESTKIDAVNPIGCGDSFTAGIAEGIINKYSLQKTVETGRDYASKNALNLRPGWILKEL